MRAITKVFSGEWYPPFVSNELEGAKRDGIKYLMIVCDTFNDYESIGFNRDSNQLPSCDYPVYIEDEDELKERYDHYDGKNMQEVQGIYQLFE